MSRKHFEEIARIISGVEDNRERWRLTAEMCRVLRETNPRFDSEKFRQACNPKEGDQ